MECEYRGMGFCPERQTGFSFPPLISACATGKFPVQDGTGKLCYQPGCFVCPDAFAETEFNEIVLGRQPRWEVEFFFFFLRFRDGSPTFQGLPSLKRWKSSTSWRGCVPETVALNLSVLSVRPEFYLVPSPSLKIALNTKISVGRAMCSDCCNKKSEILGKRHNRKAYGLTDY
jgi:hypothetical protein